MSVRRQGWGLGDGASLPSGAPRACDTVTSFPRRRTRAEDFGRLSKATATVAMRESVQ